MLRVGTQTAGGIIVVGGIYLRSKSESFHSRREECVNALLKLLTRVLSEGGGGGGEGRDQGMFPPQSSMFPPPKEKLLVLLTYTGNIHIIVMDILRGQLTPL